MIFKIRRNDEDIGNRKRGGAIQTPLVASPPPPLPVRKISTEMKIIAVLEEKEG
jgi:hypothetical protein